MSTPRRHHFVQAAHIRQFADDSGKISVYAKDGNKFPTTPEGIFVQRDLNSYETPEGVDTRVEKLITVFENETFPSILRTIGHGRIEEIDLPSLTAYLAISRMRNPSFQAGVIELHRRHIDTVAKMMDRQGRFDEIGPCPFEDGRRLSDLLDDGTFQIEINNSVYLRQIFDLAEQIQSLLVNDFRWSLIRSARGRVLISDHPFVFVHPAKDFGAYGLPMGGSGCEVSFPLSKNFYLFGAWEDQLRDCTDEDQVDELNKRQAIFANRHIASEHASRKWQELSLRYKHWGFQTRVDVLGGPMQSYQIIRGNVFPIGQVPTKVRYNPLLKTRRIAKRKRSQQA